MSAIKYHRCILPGKGVQALLISSTELVLNRVNVEFILTVPTLRDLHSELIFCKESDEESYSNKVFGHATSYLKSTNQNLKSLSFSEISRHDFYTSILSEHYSRFWSYWPYIESETLKADLHSAALKERDLLVQEASLAI